MIIYMYLQCLILWNFEFLLSGALYNEWENKKGLFHWLTERSIYTIKILGLIIDIHFCQTFPAKSNVREKGLSLPEWSTLQLFYSRVGS